MAGMRNIKGSSGNEAWRDKQDHTRKRSYARI